jgi:LPXTG-motif cell wall-anchored protein
MGLVALVAAVVVPLTFGTANAAGTATWTGATDGNWNVATNWQANTLPSNGDALVFPNAAANHTMTNNLAGSWDSIDFQGTAFNISGNTVSVANGITSSATNTIDADITLTGDQAFAETGSTQLVVNGNVNINGHTLTITNPNISSVKLLGGVSGTGTIVNNAGQSSSTMDFGGTSTYTGSISIPFGMLFLSSSVANSTSVSVTGGGELAGTGTIGDLTVDGAGAEAIVGSPSGVITAHNPTFQNGGKLVESFHPNACASLGSSGQLSAIGTVTLTGGNLQLAGGGNSQPGQVCTLIDNDGSDPVVGTFTGLPEGALVDAGGGSSDIFQLSYVGGTGNDVTLTAVGGPAFSGPGTLRLERSTDSIGEGGGTFSFRVFRLGGSVGNAMYQFATSSGTATSGSDFVGSQAQDNLNTGETVDSFGVSINNDSNFEGDETFSAGLSNVSVASLGSPSSETVTIVDDDSDPGPTSTTTTTAAPTTTTTPAGVTTTTTASDPADPPATTSTTLAPVTATTKPKVAPTKLPYTGNTSGWLVAVGVACLATGTFLSSLRRRAAAR